MSEHPPTEPLAVGYEALRAEATGALPGAAPRGRALVLGQGLPAWVRAWAAPPVVSPPPPSGGSRSGAGGPGAEVVRLLTEMALGARPAAVVS